jgi:FkbM family methyltransferase
MTVSSYISTRKKIKTVFQNLGLLPTFWFIRRLCKATIKGGWMLPLNTIGNFGFAYSNFIFKIFPEYKLAKDFFGKKIDDDKIRVSHNGPKGSVNFTFYIPNSICDMRANTLSTKEPETLEWIDKFADGGVLYDIGANVGIYTVYHAKTQNALVYAFEPSVFNLPTLVKNVNINNLQSKVRFIFNPLTSSNQISDFKLADTNEGGAYNAFGVDFGHDGSPMKSICSYKTLGLNLDYLLESGTIKDKPRLIKIDVDGIEHIILGGAIKTLSDPVCKSVLVEIDEIFSEQGQEVKRILKSCGFEFAYKKRAPYFEAQGPNAGTYNHIWVKR